MSNFTFNLPAPEGTQFMNGCFDLMVGRGVLINQYGETITGTLLSVDIYAQDNIAVLEIEVPDIEISFDSIYFNFAEEEEDE